MKKLLSVILAVVIVASVSVTAFAATINTANGSDSADVNGKYNATATTDVYVVDIKWGAMEFDYNAGGQKWNSETHKWEADPEATASWTVKDASNTITLANHSSKAVNATFAFDANVEYTDLSGAFTYDNAPLEGALNLEMPQADIEAKEYVVFFTPSGSIPATHSTTAYEKMGAITVTIG